MNSRQEVPKRDPEFLVPRVSVQNAVLLCSLGRLHFIEYRAGTSGIFEDITEVSTVCLSLSKVVLRKLI
jgi:hypothetical protein